MKTPILSLLRKALPKKQAFVFIIRAYDQSDYELVGRFFVEALELPYPNFLTYSAPYEDPEDEWPTWLQGEASYNGDSREQSDEQIAWLRENIARLIDADLRNIGTQGPHLHVGLSDRDTLYIDVSAGAESLVQSLPAYQELALRGAWQVAEEQGFRFFR